MLLLLTFFIVLLVSSFLLLKFYRFGWENGFGLDEIRHHKVIPGTNYDLYSPDYENLTELYMKKSHALMHVKTNSLGFVGKEPSMDESKKIILLLGDSQTEGAYINESFGKILEKNLTSYYTTSSIEIVNAGLGSYSPIIEYNLLKNEGLRFRPAMVILTLDMTDVADDYRYSKSIKHLDADTYIFDFKKPLFSSHESLYNDFKLLFSIFKSYGDKINNYFSAPKDKEMDKMILQKLELKGKNSGNIDLDPVYAYSYKNYTKFQEHLNLTFHYIKKADELAKSNNIKFVLHAFPHSPQVSKEYGCFRASMGLEKGKIYPTKIFDELKKFAAQNNITLIMSRQVLAESKIPPFYPCDMHLNQYGHELIANNIFENIIVKKWL